MLTLHDRCRALFPASRRLRGKQPSDEQLDNVVTRLAQIFTHEELSRMDETTLMHEVERVWPIAQYVDLT